MHRYKLVLLDTRQSWTTDSTDVAQCWTMFVQALNFDKYYIVEEL